MGHCAVLPGFSGVLVQGLLFSLSAAALGLKFWRDASGRTAGQFALDSSKQIAGAGWTHCLNLLCAWALGQSIAGGDQCDVYWVEIMLDTTLGVAVEFYLLQLLLFAVRRTMGATASASCASGRYFDSSGGFLLGGYALQLCFWLLVVTGMKCAMVLLMLLGAPLLQPVTAWLLAPVLHRPLLKLLIVMILTPGAMNALQFWLVDNIFVHAREEPQFERSECPEAVPLEDMERGVQRSGPSQERAPEGAANAVLLSAQPCATKMSR
jgi:hypothetical protein